MRVLVTGASGFFGTWLLRRAPAEAEVVAVVYTTPVGGLQTVKADLRSSAETLRAVETASPDIVIHAAYRQDRAAIVAATTNVATAAAEHGAAVVLISTEAVFAGDGRPRAETEPPDPVWPYGRWKAEAERAVMAAAPTAAVVRLPLLISTDPPDGVTRMILAAVDGNGSVGWFDGERRQPAYACDVAAGLWRIVLQPPDLRAGVWHLPGPEVLTRKELGVRLARQLDVPDRGVVVPAPGPTERPHDLRLSGQRAVASVNWAPRRISD